MCNRGAAECEASISDAVDHHIAQLGVGPVDLLLLHRPPVVRKARGKSLEQSQCQQVQAQWRAFESAFRRGQARAIRSVQLLRQHVAVPPQQRSGGARCAPRHASSWDGPRPVWDGEVAFQPGHRLRRLQVGSLY